MPPYLFRFSNNKCGTPMCARRYAFTRVQSRQASETLWSASASQSVQLFRLVQKQPRNCLFSTVWRRRVEVESTIRPAKGRITGFEGREDHRPLVASVFISASYHVGEFT